MAKWIVFLTLLVIPLGSQDYLYVKCRGRAGAPPGTNYLLMTGQAAYPLCLALGPTLKITVVDGYAQLDAVPLAAPGTAGVTVVWSFEEKPK